MEKKIDAVIKDIESSISVKRTKRGNTRLFAFMRVSLLECNDDKNERKRDLL